MLKSYVEAVCWMSRREGAVLVVTESYARLVDRNHDNDGLNLRAAHALINDVSRLSWFTFETNGERRILRLGDGGFEYHRQLVARRRCVCPRRSATAAQQGGV